MRAVKKRAEGQADKLIREFEEALDKVPHLVFEIGYTRPTGWMVHLWNATGIGIKDSVKVFTVQSDSHKKAIRQALRKLEKFINS